MWIDTSQLYQIQLLLDQHYAGWCSCAPSFLRLPERSKASNILLLSLSQGSQEQEVKFQDQIFRKFQEIFVGFTRLKTHKMHVLLCSQILIKQISTVVIKMLLRLCYT